MEPMMEYLVNIQEGVIPVYKEQLDAVNNLIVDLDNFYAWATEEIKIKNMRMELLNNESKEQYY